MRKLFDGVVAGLISVALFVLFTINIPILFAYFIIELGLTVELHKKYNAEVSKIDMLVILLISSIFSLAFYYSLAKLYA